MNKPRLGDLADDDINLVKVDKDKAGVLNKYFAIVYTRENLVDQASLEAKYEGPLLTIPDVSIETINKKLHNLKVNKSKGPDVFHPRVLKEAVDTIASPLSTIHKKVHR